MLRSFEDIHGGKSIRAITKAEVKAWVKSFGEVAPKTRKNRTLALQSLFNWTEIHLPDFKNTVALFPVVKGRKPKKAIVRILTPEQAEQVMRYFERHAPARYTATMALLLFGGLRPYELLRSDSLMTWRQIDLDAGKIEVLGTDSKTGYERTVPICENLRHWLTQCKGQGRISPAKARFGAIRRKACESAGVDWVNDMPRHSYASYAGEKLGHHLAAQHLGHTGGLSIYMTHYKGKATLAEAERYFKIEPVPTEGAKIIQLEGVA
jgi:integrase